MTLNWIEIVKQTKRSERYWKPRLQNPLHKAYNENEESLKAWLSFYEDAKKDIDSELLDVYKKIGKDEPLISDFYRKNHLQQIEKQIEKTVLAIGKKEELYTKGRIKHGISLGTRTVSEVLGTPLLNQRAIDELIKRPWAEGDFSSRIWDNKAQLIANMKSELTAGIVKGDGIYKVADRLDARMNVGRSDTQRLVRTEYMHALNAGQIETYKANGVKQVEWVATMDNAGCDTCKSRNHKVYDIDKIPHIHPNCRCTTIPYISEEIIDQQAEELEEVKKQVINLRESKEKSISFVEVDGKLRKDFQIQSDKWVDSLERNEVRALSNFTEDWYGDMNGLLIDPNFDSIDNDYVYFNIDYLDQALSKFSLNRAIITYRGISKKEKEFILKGDTFKEFKSMSANKKVAQDFSDDSWDSGGIVKFKIPKGTEGAYIGDNSEVPGEQEFLLNRGSKYTVEETDEGLEVTIIGKDKKKLPSYFFDDDEY